MQEPVEKIGGCMICGKPDKEWIEEQVHNLATRPQWRDAAELMDIPHWALCSKECCKKWSKGNSMWNTLRIIKHVTNLEYPEFNRIFEFDEDGGYAKDKFIKMNQAPLYFLFTLDKQNVYKLSQVKR